MNDFLRFGLFDDFFSNVNWVSNFNAIHCFIMFCEDRLSLFAFLKDCYIVCIFRRIFYNFSRKININCLFFFNNCFYDSVFLCSDCYNFIHSRLRDSGFNYFSFFMSIFYSYFCKDCPFSIGSLLKDFRFSFRKSRIILNDFSMRNWFNGYF